MAGVTGFEPVLAVLETKRTVYIRCWSPKRHSVILVYDNTGSHCLTSIPIQH